MVNQPINISQFNWIKNLHIRLKVLFILSLASNIISLAFFRFTNYLTIPLYGFLSTLFWLSSIVLLGIFLYRLQKTTQTRPDKKELLTFQEKIIFWIIIGFAFIIRIFKMSYFGLFVDDWLWLDHANKILGGQIFTPFGFLVISHPICRDLLF